MVLSSLISVFSIKKGDNLHDIGKDRGTGGSGIPKCRELWVQCGGVPTASHFLVLPSILSWAQEWFKQELVEGSPIQTG